MGGELFQLSFEPYSAHFPCMSSSPIPGGVVQRNCPSFACDCANTILGAIVLPRDNGDYRKKGREFRETLCFVRWHSAGRKFSFSYFEYRQKLGMGAIKILLLNQAEFHS